MSDRLRKRSIANRKAARSRKRLKEARLHMHQEAVRNLPLAFREALQNLVIATVAYDSVEAERRDQPFDIRDADAFEDWTETREAVRIAAHEVAKMAYALGITPSNPDARTPGQAGPDPQH